MRLVDFDSVEDIAIFRAYDNNYEDTAIFRADHNNYQHHNVKVSNRVLRLDELDVFSPTTRETGITCFAVAYSSADLPVDEKWLRLIAQRAPALHANIMKEYNPTSRYAYMLATYFITLKKSEAVSLMIHDIDDRQGRKSLSALQPQFDAIFKPNQRALAVGRVIPKGINQTLNVPAKVDFFKGKYVESEPVSVSSYYGCAGGMVVIFKVREHL